MLIGHFTERPYQDEEHGFFGSTTREAYFDLGLSNKDYDPRLGALLYHRYLDEKLAAEEAGFDALMLNEHHSTPACMGGVMNVEAAILARITTKPRILLLGNILPIWEDPLWLAESLAEIDMISRGRLVTGWVHGSGRESVSHNAQPPFNRERFEEAHDFIVAAWTKPGPFRWEGEHYNYRYVNPFTRPYQSPHPAIWIPGGGSKESTDWAAAHRYPYVMLATAPEATRQSFEFYAEHAREHGYEAGPQHRGYLFKVHVEATDELAYEVGRKYIQGPPNPFLEGNQGGVHRYLQNLPGLAPRNRTMPAAALNRATAYSRGLAPPPESGTLSRIERSAGTYEQQVERMTIITGSPKTVIEKLRYILELLRPGSIILWDGEGAMSHEDAMRSMKLMGEEVMPAVREIGRELGLHSPFEVDPVTNKPARARGDVAAGEAGRRRRGRLDARTTRGGRRGRSRPARARRPSSEAARRCG